MRWLLRSGAVALAGAALCISVDARAAGEPQPIHLKYVAHAGCPDVTTFTWDVGARTQRLRLAQADELAVVVSVRIELEEGKSVGTLEISGQTGPFVRRVETGSCEDIVVALSLVLALAYDPDALVMLPDREPPPPAAPVVPVAPAAPAPLSPPLAPPSADSGRADSGPAGPGGPAGDLGHAAAGVGGLLLHGIAPGLQPMLAPFIEYGASGDGWFTPRVAVTLLWAPPAEVVAGQTATFRFMGGRLEGCPVAAHLAGGLSASPCLGGEVGQILANGPPAGGKVGSAAWLALVLLGHLRWEPGGPLFGEVAGGAGITLKQPTFAFSEPRPEAVHTVPVVSAEIGLGVGVHFP
jgi:hypothetical protein